MKKKHVEYILLCIVLVSLFRPAPLTEYAYIKYAVHVITIVSFMIFGILNLFLYKKKKKLSMVFWFLLLYELCIVISTIYNNGYIISTILNALKILAFVLVFEYYLKTKPKVLLEEVFFIMTIFLIVNSLCLIFPNFLVIKDNSASIYFLGIRTRFSDLIFPYIMLSIIRNYELRRNILLLMFSIAISVFNILYVHIGTAIAGLIIFLALYALDKHMSLLKKITAKLTILGSLGINICICFFRIQTYFSFFIEKVLHESVNLTNRTLIWDKIFKVLKNNWILGLGVRNAQSTYVFHRGRYVHAHNQMLQILCEGGIVSLIFYVMAILKSVTKINKDNIIFSVSIAMLSTVLIMMTVERYGRYVYFYIILYVIYYSENIVEAYLRKVDIIEK